MPNPHVITTVRCACCGKVKQESNHWFIVWYDAAKKSFHCMPIDARAYPNAPLEDSDVPVCGQTCAQRELEKWMTQVRNAAAKTDTTEARQTT